MSTSRFDAVVVGSGPNGLSAAIALRRAGRSVLVLEGADELGGGLRSSELTLPGFVHDECASVLALVDGSPFLRQLPLRDFGLQLVHPRSPLAHPLDDGSAVVLERSVQATAAQFGADGPAYVRLMAPLVAAWPSLTAHLLAPLQVPRHPIDLMRFGLAGILPASVLARAVFRQAPARALLGGISAHSILPLERPASAAFGLVLGMLAHAVGWPVARGGSRNAARALVDYLRALGGQARASYWVASLDDADGSVPPHEAALLDLTPRQVLDVAGARLPAHYRRQLQRYRYGPGVCKVDWALDDPIPWTATGCRRAGTVHLGGTLEEVAAAEAAVWRGEHPRRPFVILVQPTVADPSRAPAGKHTAWAYCHVPNGSRVDMTAAIEAQVERFAPGFQRRVLARVTRTASELQAYNPNYVGGDINGGVQDLLQLWTRPVPRLTPYATPDPRLYICSSATPPGGGVHGMCGAFAARAVVKQLRRTQGNAGSSGARAYVR